MAAADPTHDLARFHSRYEIDAGTGCWLWTGATDVGGYGKFSIGRRYRVPHRWYYERVVGPVPPGLTLDHLCRVRRCVNPTHLEPVTNRENTMRGRHPGVLRHHARTCKRGHTVDGDNLYVPPRHPGQRVCVQCMKDKQARRTQKARAMAKARS